MTHGLCCGEKVHLSPVKHVKIVNFFNSLFNLWMTVTKEFIYLFHVRSLKYNPAARSFVINAQNQSLGRSALK